MQRKGSKVPSWVPALLLIFSLSIVGLGISKFIGNFIPLWILFGFSLIFSIDKWFYHTLIRYKAIGTLYRILLNLSLLSLIGLIIWTCIKLFSIQFLQNPLIGSLVFMGELVFLIWLWRIVAKNSWRKPSMKLTAFALVVIVVIFAFAGVQPITSYKDDAIGKVTTFFNQQKEKAELKLEQDNSEQAKLATKNNETIGDSIVSKAVNIVDDSWDTSVDDYANKFNQYRRSKGLTSLQFTNDLNQLAELRLKELYKSYNHYSAGKYNEHLAENIVMSTGLLSNTDALVTWQNSPGHNENMLKSSYKYTGYAIGNGYAVQLFTEYPTINGKPQLPPGWHWAD
jgi:uncharacterized protein YkwD